MTFGKRNITVKKLIILLAALTVIVINACAQDKGGGITPEMLEGFRKAQTGTQADKALRKVFSNNNIDQLAKNLHNPLADDKNFSHSVSSKGITDQMSSGRCWLFSGLNVLRAQMIAKYNLGAFQFSQNYCFFYDQLEKSNLFLQSVIDSADKPFDEKYVEWLFKNPISDGGQFTGISDIVTKYGLVPAEVMPETTASNYTNSMAKLVSYKLRQFGLELREAVANKTKKTDIQKRKTEMLGTVYHMLTMFLGEPPTQFEWTRTDSAGKKVDTRTYTPLGFYKEYVGQDLKNSYVMLMNDPTRPYYKTYEIDMDRHAYDGENWTYINLPMDSIKQIAIRSIKDSVMMYYSCDVGKFLDNKTGLLDENNYDYSLFLGVDFNMTKEQRIRTFASMSSHAMTLMAVDLDSDGKPVKWKVENSWGTSSGQGGYLVMTDKWFDDYTFRLVAEKRFVSPETLKLLEQKPTLLPPWDPLFAAEQ